jgi:acyl carrier protein
MTQTNDTDLTTLMHEVAEMIVTALNLEMSASEIKPDTPLFGEGLGLDSIDILEIALAVSKHYGFQLRADDDANIKVFTNLQTLASHIAANRTK